jgi:hypothetical protein
MASLKDLPNELLSEIIRLLHPAKTRPANANPSRAQKLIGDAVIQGPDYDKHKQVTSQLLNLCLTSKRLLGLAEAILYSSLIIDTRGATTNARSFCLLFALLSKPVRGTWIKSLQHFCRTFDTSDYELAELQYERHQPVEKTFHCSHIKRSQRNCKAVIMAVVRRVWKDTPLEDWSTRFQKQPNDVLLALFVVLSPNVTYLRFEIGYRRLWLLRVIRQTDFAHHPEPLHQGFNKLTQLSMFTGGHFSMTCTSHRKSCKEQEVEDCRTIASFLRELPSLRYYDHSSMCCNFTTWSTSHSYEKLVVLKLAGCALSVERLGGLVHACSLLEEFSCEWHGS